MQVLNLNGQVHFTLMSLLINSDYCFTDYLGHLYNLRINFNNMYQFFLFLFLGIDVEL